MLFEKISTLDSHQNIFGIRTSCEGNFSC
jgi:hypothetical protein